jgi:hypothetical protein
VRAEVQGTKDIDGDFTVKSEAIEADAGDFSTVFVQRTKLCRRCQSVGVFGTVRQMDNGTRDDRRTRASKAALGTRRHREKRRENAETYGGGGHV